MRCLSVMLAAITMALAASGVAHAGCWATVGIEPLPTAIGAGQTWTVDVTVLQHGVTPLGDAAPAIVVKSESGAERVVPAVRTEVVGRYRANVVFPSSGTWSVAVQDGFPEPDCERTHTFGSYSIRPSESPPGGQASPTPVASSVARAPDDDSSLWPLWLGLGLAGMLAVAGLSAARLRRST